MLTSEQVYLFLAGALIFFGIVIALIGSMWISYKRDKDIPQKERKPNPFMQAIIVSFFFLAIFAFVNLFEKGFLQKYWWVSLIIFLIVFSVYLYVLRKRRPLNIYQQDDLCKDVMECFFHAQGYKGNVNYLPLDAVRTTSEKGRPNIGNWLRTAEASSKIDFFIQIDKFTKEILTLVPNPSSIIKDKMLEQKFPAQKKTTEEVLSDDVVEEETTEQQEAKAA